MAKKNQSRRLTNQHKESQGVVGIFGEEAKLHDIAVGEVALSVMVSLKKKYTQLKFRHRDSITKKEINSALKNIDPTLGQTLYVSNASIL